MEREDSHAGQVTKWTLSLQKAPGRSESMCELEIKKTRPTDGNDRLTLEFTFRRTFPNDISADIIADFFGPKEGRHDNQSNFYSQDDLAKWRPSADQWQRALMELVDPNELYDPAAEKFPVIKLTRYSVQNSAHQLATLAIKKEMGLRGENNYHQVYGKYTEKNVERPEELIRGTPNFRNSVNFWTQFIDVQIRRTVLPETERGAWNQLFQTSVIDLGEFDSCTITPRP